MGWIFYTVWLVGMWACDVGQKIRHKEFVGLELRMNIKEN